MLGCECRRATPADAGAERDAGTVNAVRLAPPAPRSCASLDACLGACDGGVASGCYDATLFLLEARGEAGRDLSPIAGLAGRACDGGDGRGCARAERFEDATRLLPAQCEGGDIEACELWFSSSSSLDAGVTAARAAARAHALLEAACESQPWACARLGSSLTRARLGVTDVKRGIALLEQACDAGVAGACIEATLIFTRGVPGIEPDPSRAAKAGRRARELSQ